MAGVVMKTTKKGTVCWYAAIHTGGNHYRYEPLRGPKGTPVRDRTHAEKLAGTAQRRWDRSQGAQQLASKRIIFKTAWVKFLLDHMPELAWNTQEDYRHSYNAHIQHAAFAVKRVSTITIDDLRDYVSSKKGILDPHTVNNHTRYLSVFFRWATENGYYPAGMNPAKAMGIRQKLVKKDLVFLNAAQSQIFIDEMAVEGEKYQTLAAMLIWTGIRWSEARALTWDHVHVANSKRASVFIDKTAIRNTIQSHPKSSAGERTVAVPPTLARMLASWKKNPANYTLSSEKVDLGIAHDLVFPNDVGRLLHGENFRRRQFAWAKARAIAKDPTFPSNLTVHGLRHTYATNLLAQGADVFSLKSELGHASIQSSIAYTHYQPELGNPITADMVEKSISTAKRGARKIGAKNAATNPAAKKPAVKKASTKTTAAKAATKTKPTGAQP